MKTAVSPALREVIDASWFTLEPGVYVYLRVTEVTRPELHLLVTRDSEEITVVTDSRNLPLMGEYERNAENWKLLNIRCGKPFYCVGFLAAIAQQMASHGIDIVMTSTFSNDHVLVKEEEAEMAIGLLCDLGFSKR